MSFPDLFDHFDHVYIVNLPYRDDRRRETIADFARVGMTIPNEHITFFEASRPTEKGYERILICEDDLELNELPDTTVAKVLSDLKTTHWSVAALGYLEPETPPTDTVGLSEWTGGTRGTQFSAIQGDSIRAFHDYLELVRSRPSGHPEGGSMFFDGAFNMVRTIVPGTTFRLATPCLAGQRSSRTDIHDLRFYDRVEPFRSIVGALRKVMNRAKG